MTETPPTAADAASPAAAEHLPDPDPASFPPDGRPGGGDRFFAWVSDLGMVRADGWLGGVCAGIASRIGVDPVIVRGVFVVAALFGLPVFVVYAVGWALLPDLEGRIHLRELVQRRFDPAIIGIAVMLVLGSFPVVPWFFAVALPFGVFDGIRWFEPTPLRVLSALLLVAVVGGAIYLLARSPRRAPSSGVPDPRTASADPKAPGAPARDDSGVRAPADPAQGDASASSDAAGSAPPPPPAEPLPVAGATDADLADWRARHAAWRVQHDSWRRQQQDADRAARDRARADRTAAASAFAAEAAERRRVRRATRPRTSVGYVVLVVGVALVVGALTALGRRTAVPDEPVMSVALGLFASALAVALAMIVAGALRRRSGFLAFLAALLLVAGASTAAVPVTRGIVFGSTYVDSSSPRSFTQLWGSLNISATVTDRASPAPIMVKKRLGDTYISVEPGVILALEVVAPDAVVWSTWDWSRGEAVDGGTWTGTATSDERVRMVRTVDNSLPPDSHASVDDSTWPSSAPVTQSVTLDQDAGAVIVTVNQP